MKCDKNHEMTLEEALIHRTTSPLEDDTYEIVWWCDKCQEAKPLEEGSDEIRLRTDRRRR